MKQLALILWISLLFLHSLGVLRGLNASVGFYDMVLHFFGGALVSLTILIFLKSRTVFHFIFAFTATITIGVFWESFEMLLDIFITPNFSFPIPRKNLLDTLSDIFFDGAGSIFTLIIYFVRNILSKRLSGR